MRYQWIPVLIAVLACLICLRPEPVHACNPQQQIIQQPMAIAQQNYGCYGSQPQQVYYQPQQQLTLPEEVPDTGCQQCQQQALYQPQQQILLQQQAPAYYQPQRQVLLQQQVQPTYAVQPQRQVLLQQQVQPVYAQQRQVLLQQAAPTYAVQRQRVLAVQQPANCYGGSANQVLAIQQRQRQRLQLLGGRKHNAQQVVLQQSAGDYGQGFVGGGTVQSINVGRRGLFGR